MRETVFFVDDSPTHAVTLTSCASGQSRTTSCPQRRTPRVDHIPCTRRLPLNVERRLCDMSATKASGKAKVKIGRTQWKKSGMALETTSTLRRRMMKTVRGQRLHAGREDWCGHNARSEQRGSRVHTHTPRRERLKASLRIRPTKNQTRVWRSL